MNLEEILNNTDEKIINVPRYNFGNNNHKTKQKGLTIENYI